MLYTIKRIFIQVLIKDETSDITAPILAAAFRTILMLAVRQEHSGSEGPLSPAAGKFCPVTSVLLKGYERLVPVRLGSYFESSFVFGRLCSMPLVRAFVLVTPFSTYLTSYRRHGEGEVKQDGFKLILVLHLIVSIVCLYKLRYVGVAGALFFVADRFY